MQRPRLATSVTCVACIVLAPAAATAREASREVTPERVQAAAFAYDAGRRAYVQGSYEEAAGHFENAWYDAPRPEALRNAIRSHLRAKQLARAATLALFGARSYPDDAETMTLVRETLGATSSELQKVTIRCAPACAIMLDKRAVSAGESEELAFYTDPGDHHVLVSWSGGRTKPLAVHGVPGGAQDVTLEAPPPATVAEVSPRSLAAQRALSPAVFIVGLAVTAAGAAATVVSAVDAKNDPGEDAVRRDCVGLGTSCPTYQRGLDAQLRTNVLFGSTVLVAAATAAIGLLFTRWTATSPRNGVRAFVGADGAGGYAGLSGSM